MQRRRAITAGLTGLVLGAGLALGGATSASAASAGHWGTFTVSGTNRDYTGTMTLAGFPDTTFTSNSRQTDPVSGATTYQPASTGPGARYGSSKNLPYLGQRPLADAPNPRSASVTTYAFAEPTPAGSWSFVLGDIDADQATIAATLPGGGTATAAELGFQGAYNSCSVQSPGGRSCPADPDGTTGRDEPTWDAATRTLVGFPDAADTAGATGWFTPTVPLSSLTITYQQRSGFPVYQTWFASRTAAITGVATLDGTPVPGTTVTVTAPNGVVTTTTTAADGSYAFPELPVVGGYTVAVTRPTGAEGTATRTVSLDQTSQGVDARADFAFTAPTGTTSILGSVTDGAGRPAADVPVVVTAAGAPVVATTTNADGFYVGSGLPAGGQVSVTVDGGTPVPVQTGAAGTVATPPAIVAMNAVGTVRGTVSLSGAPVAGVQVELVAADGSVSDTATTGTDGQYTFTTVGGTYTVRSAQPTPDAEGATTSSPVTVVGGGAPQTRDFAFTAPAPATPVTTRATGRVVDQQGGPVGGVVVTATARGEAPGAPVTAITAADGTYTLSALAPSTPFVVTAPGVTASAQFVSGATASSVVRVADLVVPTAAPAPTATPTVSPTAVPTVSTTGGNGGTLAFTGADPTPGLLAAGVLLLLGTGLLTVRSVRNRRRSSHLRD